VSFPLLDQIAFQRRLRVAIVTPLVLLVMLVTAFLALIYFLQLTAQQGAQSNRILLQSSHLEQLLVEREMRLSSYLDTGNTTSLDAYRQVQSDLGPAFDMLALLVADNPIQTAQLAELRRMSEQPAQLEELLVAPNSGAGQSLRSMLHSASEQQLDAMFTKLAVFREIELARRNQRERTATRATTVVVGGGVLLSIGLGYILVLLTYRQLRGLTQRYGRALADSHAQTAELATIRRHNQLILDAVDEGIYGLDRHGLITFANPAAARMLGWEPSELLGQPSHALLHHSDAEGAPDPIERSPITTTLRDGVVRRIENAVFWRKDGVSFPVEYASSPIFDAGVIAGAVVTFRDISERRRLEAQLTQAQKLESIGRLAGGIAHDFNNLLTTIASCAELARDSLPAAHPVQEDLRTIQDIIDRAHALTRQLLTFARKQAIVPQQFSLNDLIGDIDQLLRRLLGSNIALVAHLAPDLGLVYADRTQIEQVLLNLAVNARDAMPGGGKLSIETANVELDATYAQQHVQAQPGPYVMLAVSDTGNGIPAALQPHIFEPFFTTKDSNNGTGLGLATSYGIIQRHGGTLWVYSEIDRGTTFKVYLPRTALATSPAIDTPRGTETILLIEDEDLVRVRTAEVLREHGYTVLEGATGEAGRRLSRAHRGTLNLLLTDITLPDTDGMKLADELGARHSGIKILFVSGYTEQALIHHGRLALDTTVLHKPFAAGALLRAVRRVLDGRS